MDKNEIIKYQNNNINRLEICEIKKAILREVFYFNETKGCYIFRNKFLQDKYNEVLEGKNIVTLINDLIDSKLLYSEHKKEVYNGKWVTTVYLGLNRDTIDKITIKRVLEELTKNNKGLQNN